MPIKEPTQRDFSTSLCEHVPFGIPFSHSEKPLFESIVLKTGEGLPIDKNGKPIDLTGAVIITKDKNPRTKIHKIIYPAQVISNWLFGKTDADPAYCHTVLVIGRDLDADEKEKPGKEDHLIIADSGMPGIIVNSRDYLSDPTLDEVVIFRPVDPELRELLLKHAWQTAYVPKELRSTRPETDKKVKKAAFSLKDLGTCWYCNPFQGTESPEGIKRTAYVISDLLRGDQILDDKEEPHAFFCTPYVTSLLQGSVMIQKLSSDQKQKILFNSSGNRRSRDEVANIIARHIEEWWEGHTLSTTYRENPLCSLNARWLMSCHAGSEFEKLSTPMTGVTQRSKAPSTVK